MADPTVGEGVISQLSRQWGKKDLCPSSMPYHSVVSFRCCKNKKKNFVAVRKKPCKD